MFDLFTRIPTTKQLRELEALWIKQCSNYWGSVLMELAGNKASEYALSLMDLNLNYQGDEIEKIIVVCGRGNNGGDGLVVARHLFLAGLDVDVYIIGGNNGASKMISNEAQVNLDILHTLEVKVTFLNDDNYGILEEALLDGALIVDALLGTGIDRSVEGIYAQIIEIINASEKPVLSIDVPSGINSDNGQIMGAAIRATATATFSYYKAGLLIYPGFDLAGEIKLFDIGLPYIDSLPDTFTQESDVNFLSPRWGLADDELIADLLPARPQASHKGTFGQVLTIAGSFGMAGAAFLAARTALKSGCGLSILATAKSLVIEMPPEEVIFRGVAETNNHSIALTALSEIEKEIESANALILGPGLSMNSETIKFVQALVPQINKPCIIDADALNALAKIGKNKFANGHLLVLTPHPKELSRLLDVSTEEIQSDRLFWAAKAAQEFGCTVVLKGAHSIVASAYNEAFIIPTGNSGMSTAGAGDVLSGIIGAFLAQGLEPNEAAVAGAYVHGIAGDLAAESIGEDGMTASDISNMVPHALQELRKLELVSN
jgi:NAD(P)H-hydrate epimerase